MLTLLTDSAKIAQWSNENLPNDRTSIENAMILTSTDRWPLMIDPQLQGIKWIKTREGAELKIVRLGQKGYLDAIERAVSNGDCLLLENIEESIDPVLDSLVGRLTIKKGRQVVIKGSHRQLPIIVTHNILYIKDCLTKNMFLLDTIYIIYILYIYYIFNIYINTMAECRSGRKCIVIK